MIFFRAASPRISYTMAQVYDNDYLHFLEPYLYTPMVAAPPLSSRYLTYGEYLTALNAGVYTRGEEKWTFYPNSELEKPNPAGPGMWEFYGRVRDASIQGTNHRFNYELCLPGLDVAVPCDVEVGSGVLRIHSKLIGVTDPKFKQLLIQLGYIRN